MKTFNYVVGYYWSNSQGIGCYNYFGEVQFGTVENAEGFLEYVKIKSPKEDWKIFVLTEYKGL